MLTPLLLAIAQEACLLEKAYAEDLADQAEFGFDIAVEGSFAFVGAPGTYFGPPGAVYVLERHGELWAPREILAPADGVSQDRFGWSLDADADTLVVGAFGYDVVPTSDGAVFVYERVDSAWIETARILSPTTGSASFGYEVAIDGDVLAVGTGAGGARRAYVYERAGSDWEFVAEFAGDPGTSGNCYATDLDVLDDVIVVADACDDDLGFNSGAVHVYERGPGGWGKTQKIAAPVAEPLLSFGADLALAGDLLVAGSEGDELYLFQRAAIGYQPFTSLVKTTGHGAGGDIAFRNGILAAREFDDQSLVHVFQGSNAHGSWSKTTVLAAPDGASFVGFGMGVAIEGDRVWASVPLEDVAGPDSGALYRFSLLPEDCPTLTSDVFTVSVSAGESQVLTLQAPQPLAGSSFLVLGSLSGTHPGIPLLGPVLPLNPDAYLGFVLGHPDAGVLVGNGGVLDASGSATVSFVPPPGLHGAPLVHHAALVFDLGVPSVRHVSAPIVCLVRP